MTAESTLPTWVAPSTSASSVSIGVAVATAGPTMSSSTTLSVPAGAAPNIPSNREKKTSGMDPGKGVKEADRCGSPAEPPRIGISWTTIAEGEQQ
jgi:hypothetical protein